jgi:hypothetical protein
MGDRDGRTTQGVPSSCPKKCEQEVASRNKLGVVVQTCNPSYVGGGGRKITALGKKQETLSEK